LKKYPSDYCFLKNILETRRKAKSSHFTCGKTNFRAFLKLPAEYLTIANRNFWGKQINLQKEKIIKKQSKRGGERER
jgi:hypothetical protein